MRRSGFGRTAVHFTGCSGFAERRDGQRRSPEGMATIDFVKEHPELYKGKGEWVRVSVPERTVIAVDGTGDPNTSAEYAAALQALYGIAYTAKFALKKGGRDDFKVAPLEGLWWADDYAAFMDATDKDAWNWTMFIPVPEFVTSEDVESARTARREETSGNRLFTG